MESRQSLYALDSAFENNDIPLAQAMLKKLVQGYAPSTVIADLIYREREMDRALKPSHPDQNSIPLAAMDCIK